MKKKEQFPTGVNVSSGAEKVERIDREENDRQEMAQKEALAAKERIGAATARMQAKKEKLDRKAKRKAALARRREARAKKFEAEIAAIERERIRKKQARIQRKERKKRNKPQRESYGGWLAAVVSLSVVSLLLTAALTISALNVYRANQVQTAAYRGTMYELIGVMEQVDDDLDTLRIANSASMQSELLTDVLVQTRMAENDLEKLPVGEQESRNVMSFLNGVSRVAERMLEKLRRGEKLSEGDMEILEGFYRTNHGARATLNELAATMEDCDLSCWMKGKKNRIGDAMQRIEDLTMPPEIGQIMPKMPPIPQDGAGTDEGVMPLPSMKLSDGANHQELPSAKAEELCKKYFANYSIATLAYAGETMAKGLKTYNFDLTTESGKRIFAQISKWDGALVGFDFYEECHEHVIDIETAKNVAEDFLLTLGYENMVAVDVDEEDTNVDFTFAYAADGCVYYPDEIVVKVCEQRAVVCGFDASKFLKNHRTRVALNAKITMEEAKNALHEKLTVESARLVLFEHKNREIAAYEFFCSYDGSFYCIYADAFTGEELFIVNKNVSA